MAEAKAKIKREPSAFIQKINSFFAFLGLKLKNFKNLTLGEQISYSSVGLGLMLLLVSAVLFIF